MCGVYIGELYNGVGFKNSTHRAVDGMTNIIYRSIDRMNTINLDDFYELVIYFIKK